MHHNTADILTEAAQLIFSKRQKFLRALESEVRGRLKTPVAWPDLLFLITAEDARRAYNAARPGEE
jgi:hypothetical protein